MSKKTKQRTYWQNIALCVRLGATGGAMFSLWIVFLMVVRLSVTIETDERSINGLLMILLYIGGFSVAGLIAGVLLPLARRAVGAALVGAVAGFPMGVAVTTMVTGSFALDGLHLIAAGSVSFLGLVLGLFIRAHPYKGE